MNRHQKLKALRIAIPALLMVMATGLPLYSLATASVEPRVRPLAERKVESAPAPAPASAPASAVLSQPQPSLQAATPAMAPPDTNIEALSAFYEVVIGLLVTILALVAGLAYWTVKLISEAKAEEIAREAVRKMFADSREFHTALATEVEDALEERLEEIRGRINEMEEDLEDLRGVANVDDEDVPETEVIKKGDG